MHLSFFDARRLSDKSNSPVGAEPRTALQKSDMVINTNISAQNSAALLMQSSQRLAQSLARLSSGSKIVSAADDAAGLAVSMRTNAQISRTDAASNNIANALSFSQTQDGYLNQIGNALTRMSELTVLAQDVTKTSSDRSLYNQEFQTLGTFIQGIQTKDFNGVSLFGSNGLNVTTDADGNTFSMSGVSANYLTGSTTTTTTTSTVGYAANTQLGQVSPGFASNPIEGYLGAYDSTGTGYTYSILQPTNTISDMVNALNSTSGRTSATYDANTGQLSITVNPGHYLVSDDSMPGNGSLLVDLGFGPANGLFGDLDINNSNGSSPLTVSANLTHSVTTTQTTTVGALDISSLQGASAAQKSLESAISQLATDRATVGANMERLSYNSAQLATLKNNLTAANSQITDVDVATESSNYARQNILVQAGTAMLAQANSQPSSILRLLS